MTDREKEDSTPARKEATGRPWIFASLHEANIARQREWDPDDRITLAYRGNELAGEVGEACNVIKKLERERLGINGSRDTVEHLMEELADGVICASLCAMHVGGNLDAAVEAKFNATSEKMGLKTRLRLNSLEPNERRIAELTEVIRFVESWVHNPVGAYSVHALDGLFAMTRDKIAALEGTKAQ